MPKPKNNLNLGAVVRQGTSNFARPIGKAFLELASLHPLLGIGVAGVNARFANNKTDKYLNTLDNERKYFKYFLLLFYISQEIFKFL